jgi:Uma2 family endonuclease
MKLPPRLDRPATREDLEHLPPDWRGEIIDGVLYAFPRPRAPHANAEGGIVEDLRGPFQRGRGGPGGWIILVEPGIEVPRSPEFSPDVAGWRRERLPALPRKGPITVVPDFCCEILSPRTRGYDQVIKRRFYAQIGVAYLWYVDPEAQSLTVSKLLDGRWLELGTYGADEKVRAEPFEAVEIELSSWWEAVAPGIEDDDADEVPSGP